MILQISTKTKALLSPLGDVHTSNLKGSITRESADTFITKFTENLTVDIFRSQVHHQHKQSPLKKSQFKWYCSRIYTKSRNGYTPGTYYNVKLLNSGLELGQVQLQLWLFKQEEIFLR